MALLRTTIAVDAICMASSSINAIRSAVVRRRAHLRFASNFSQPTGAKIDPERRKIGADCFVRELVRGLAIVGVRRMRFEGDLLKVLHLGRKCKPRKI